MAHPPPRSGRWLRVDDVRHLRLLSVQELFGTSGPQIVSQILVPWLSLSGRFLALNTVPGIHARIRALSNFLLLNRVHILSRPSRCSPPLACAGNFVRFPFLSVCCNLRLPSLKCSSGPSTTEPPLCHQFSACSNFAKREKMRKVI